MKLSLEMLYRAKFRNVRFYECGDYFEMYVYRGVWSRVPEREGKCRGYKWQSSEDYLERHRARVLRKRGEIRRLLKKYKFQRLLTLTFKDNITDVSLADRLFDRFIARVKRRYPEFSYVGVREFQKRGAVHYHLLIGMYIPQRELAELWGHGFVSVNFLKLKSAINYVSKYLAKSVDDERLFGRRLILKSRELYVVVRTFLLVDAKKLFDFVRGAEIDYWQFYEDAGVLFICGHLPP